MSDFTSIEYDECPKYDVFRKYLDRTLKKYNFKARYDDNKGIVKLEKNNELISIDFTNINKDSSIHAYITKKNQNRHYLKLSIHDMLEMIDQFIAS
jgi:hypothetical protein